MKKKIICFVCTGNTCRSPMAQAVVNQKYYERYFAQSAGLCASAGSDMSENAKKALSARGMKIPVHRSRQIDEDIIKSSDMVVCMSRVHMIKLLMNYPEFAYKFEMMPEEISDPYGGGEDEYLKCLDQIMRCLEVLLNKEHDS